MTYYILKIYTIGQYNVSYYKGKKYIVAGEQYAIGTNDFEEAKKYSTPARARDALIKLYGSCANIDHDATVMQIDDNGDGVLRYKTVDEPLAGNGAVAKLPDAACHEEHREEKKPSSSAKYNRYKKKHYTRLPLDVPKEMAQQFKEKCAAQGVSVGAVLKAAIKDFLEK